MLNCKGKKPFEFIKLVYKSIWVVLFAMLSADPKEPDTKLGKILECCCALLLILFFHLLFVFGIFSVPFLLVVGVVYLIELASPAITGIVGFVFLIWCLLPDKISHQPQQNQEILDRLFWDELADQIIITSLGSWCIAGVKREDLQYPGKPYFGFGYYFSLDTVLREPLDEQKRKTLKRRIEKRLAESYEPTLQNFLEWQIVEVAHNLIFIKPFRGEKHHF